MQLYISILTKIFYTFALGCLISALLAWLHYQRRTEFEKKARNLNEYRYFIQLFFENEENIVSCELILKEFDPLTKTWLTPFNRKHFPLDRLIIAVKDLQSRLPDNVNSISINMTVSQFLDHQAPNFFNWLLGILAHQKLNIEFEADELMHLNHWQEMRLKNTLEKIYNVGILITIRNIKSQDYYYAKLTQYDKYVDHYAISAHHFDLTKETLVKKWQDISDFHNKKLALTGIDSYEANYYADKHRIPIKQGRYFSDPVSLRSMQEETVE